MTDPRELRQFTSSAQNGWRTRAGRNRRVLIPLLGGISLAGWGVSRRGWLGTVAAGGGAYLALESINRIRPYHAGIHVSQTINKPVSEVYQFARNPENWALILEQIGQHENSDRTATRAPINRRMNWNAEIWKEEKDQVIAWQSHGRNPRRRGAMRFRPAPGNRGTEVILGLEFHYSDTLITRALQMLRGRDPEWRAREALRGLKQLLECGEIPTIAGQPSGRRGLKGAVMQFTFRETGRRMRLAA